MSGSNSSGESGSGGSGGRSIDCDDFAFETHISTPKQEEIKKLDVGDVLNIVSADMGGFNVVQVVNDGSIVGGLVDNGPKIMQCLAMDFTFSATVRSISGAAVKIFVQSLGQ